MDNITPPASAPLSEEATAPADAEPEAPTVRSNPKRHKKNKKPASTVEKKSHMPHPHKQVSSSSPSPKEQARARNSKRKNNDAMNDRSFTLEKEIATIGRYGYYTGVQAISKRIPPEDTILLDQGSLVKLYNCDNKPVRIYCAFVATNGNQAQLYVRTDEGEGDPFSVSVLDVAAKIKDVPPAGFWLRVAAFIEARRQAAERLEHEEKQRKKS
jgi:hypothetical protein